MSKIVMVAGLALYPVLVASILVVTIFVMQPEERI